MDGANDSGPRGGRLLDRVHAVVRARHLSLRTEEAYRSWIVRFVRFCDLRHPSELGAGSPVCLTTISSCGLRRREALDLHVDQVDGGRLLLRIRRGKGGIDHRVPVPSALLTLLRAYWRTHRNPVWMFPAPRRRPPRPVGDEFDAPEFTLPAAHRPS